MFDSRVTEPEPPEEVRLGPVFSIVAGIVLPAIGLLAGQALMPEWQSGMARDYWAVSLSFDVGVYLSPVFVVAAAGLLFSLIRPDTASLLVRIALSTGALVSLQYLIVVFFTRGELAGLGLVNYVPFVVFHELRRAGKLGSRGFVAGWLLAPSLGVADDFDPGEPVQMVSGYALYWIASLVAATPFYSLTTYAALLLRAPPLNRRAWIRPAWTAWLLAYGSSVWLAIRKVDEVYRALPTQPPDGCYVCTATARGHRWLIRSWTERCLDGSTVIVTRQMQVLKAAELALRERAPRLHRATRQLYDASGPGLAQRLSFPLAADVAYLSLKPFEWLAWLGLIVGSRPRRNGTSERRDSMGRSS